MPQSPVVEGNAAAVLEGNLGAEVMQVQPAKDRAEEVEKHVFFPDSPICHKYLDGLKGVEIGASMQNNFHLDTINVDYTDDMEGPWKGLEAKTCGAKRKVDIVAPANKLPFSSKSLDFVLASHVLEHIYNPIQCLFEWNRVAKKYIAVILPERTRCPNDLKRPLSIPSDLARIYSDSRKLGGFPPVPVSLRHVNFWTIRTFVALVNAIGFAVVDFLDPDDKAGNGFFVLLRARYLPINWFPEIHDVSCEAIRLDQSQRIN
jgi:hypothetical protein